MTEQELQDLHKHCKDNRGEIKRGAKAGCFYCLEVFPKEDVQEYTTASPKRGTADAICPKCGIDSVLSQSVFPSLADLKKSLRPMQEYWFKRKIEM
jgi:hypothetical protein